MIITGKKGPVDNDKKVLGSHVFGDHEVSFYRNKKKDVFMRCSCGYDEIVAKAAPAANDNVATAMYDAMKRHVA